MRLGVVCSEHERELRLRPVQDAIVVVVGLFLYGPLVLIAVALSVEAALYVLGKGLLPRKLVGMATGVLIVLWIAACFFAVGFRVLGRDWVHLFWSAQIPLVGLFLGSGALLCRTWRVDSENAASAAPSEESIRRKRHGWTRNGAFLFLAMTVTLGLAPLVLQIALPDDHPSPRDTGSPIQGLRELAAWGFGGPRPATLTPITQEEIARGLGHLPRDITVPMGTTLIAAYLWIAFSLLAMGGRLIRSRRARLAFYLLAPVLLGVLNFIEPVFHDRATYGALDPRFFGPDSSRESGIWTCEPAVVLSYGPVLLVAFASALVLALCLALERFTPESRGVL
jgi:hypothetical protein